MMESDDGGMLPATAEPVETLATQHKNPLREGIEWFRREFLDE